MQLDEYLITFAKNPITIDKDNNDLKGILNKILNWIELIEVYCLINNYKMFDCFNLDSTYFTHEMRLASLGREYKNWKILPFKLHENGEMWSFEQLVLASNTGLVEWYCNKFGYSKEEYEKICNDENIKILGAFYHRFKIALEKINVTINFLSGKKFYSFDLTSINKLLLKNDFETRQPSLYELCVKIKNYETNKELLIKNYIKIEETVEFAQLALFNYIREKTNLE